MHADSDLVEEDVEALELGIQDGVCFRFEQFGHFLGVLCEIRLLDPEVLNQLLGFGVDVHVVAHYAQLFLDDGEDLQRLASEALQEGVHVEEKGKVIIQRLPQSFQWPFFHSPSPELLLTHQVLVDAGEIAEFLPATLDLVLQAHLLSDFLLEFSHVLVENEDEGVGNVVEVDHYFFPFLRRKLLSLCEQHFFEARVGLRLPDSQESLIRPLESEDEVLEVKSRFATEELLINV